MSINIKILSRSKAVKESYRAMALNEIRPYIISITDMMSPNPVFVYSNRSLSLKFNDRNNDRPDGPQIEHAQAIVHFIDSLPDSAASDLNLICHCEAGICRSSAAAIAAYSLKYGTDAAKDYFKPHYGKIWPNQRLIKLIEQVAVERELLKPDELFELTNWINYYPMAGQKDDDYE